MNTYLHDSIGLLVDVSLRALLLAAAAWLVLAALLIRDSNWQHRTWTAVLTVMLLLPLLVRLTPAIPLPSWIYPELPRLAQATPEGTEIPRETQPAAPVPQAPVA